MVVSSLSNPFLLSPKTPKLRRLSKAHLLHEGSVIQTTHFLVFLAGGFYVSWT